MKRTKLSIAILALSLSSLTLAASFAPTCTKGDVTVPCAKTQFDISVYGLHLEPLLDDSVYAESVSANNSGDTYYRQHSLNPGYDFSFIIQGSYHFGTGNDFTLSWMHYDNKENDVVENLIDQPRSALLPDVAWDRITGTEEDKYDQVIAEVGQHSDYGDRYDVRTHYGVQFIQMTNNITALGESALVPINFQKEFRNSDFDAYGIHGGIDLSWHMVDGFSLIARPGAGLVVGSLKSKSKAWFNLISGSTPTNTNDIAERIVVPTYDIQLGMLYSRPISTGTFSVEGGYQFTGVYHSVRQISAYGGTAAVKNFGLHGPYLAVHYVGDLTA